MKRKKNIKRTKQEVGSWKTEENAGMQECMNAEVKANSSQFTATSCHFDDRRNPSINAGEEKKSATKEAACYGFLSSFGMTEENAEMQECGNAVETIRIDYNSTKKLVISTRNEERSETKEAACSRFLIAFGMTEENAGMQECGNVGMSAAHSYQIEGLHPACHLEGRMTERSATNEAACSRFLIAFGMTAASSFKKKYSTVFHRIRSSASSPRLGGKAPTESSGKGGQQLVFNDFQNAFRLPQTSGTGEPVFTTPYSPFGGWGATEERAIRACDLLLFNN